MGSGNKTPDDERQWRFYLSSLASSRSNISTEQLWKLLLRQNYLCALTGVRMTCVRIRYERTWTNASIDRIIPGVEYHIGNVQLVCVKANIIKSNMPLDEFIARCHFAVRCGKASEWEARVAAYNTHRLPKRLPIQKPIPLTREQLLALKEKQFDALWEWTDDKLNPEGNHD
jgi:hypothetical protein